MVLLYMLHGKLELMCQSVHPRHGKWKEAHDKAHLFLSRSARRWFRLLPHAEESSQLSAKLLLDQEGRVNWEIVGNSLF